MIDILKLLLRDWVVTNELNKIADAIQELKPEPIVETGNFFSNNWDWMIAVISLAITVMAHRQNTLNYKKETQARFEVEYYEFLIQVNSLAKVNEDLKKEIAKDLYKNKEEIYRKVLEAKLYEYTALLAPMVGMAMDYSDNFSPPIDKQNVNKIKVPLKNMRLIAQLVKKVEQINIKKNGSKEYDSATFSVEELQSDLKEVRNLIEKELEEYIIDKDNK